MIKFCQSAPPLEGPETLIGCRMLTLQACYSALPNALDWFISDVGGVLCRFGSVLLILGEVDFGEVLAFSDMLGVNRIERVVDGAVSHTRLDGWTSTWYPVLHSVGGGLLGAAELEADIELRRCFTLLCQSDPQFAREAEYLPWLSDMTRRRNTGRAEIFMYADAAVACITARGRHSAYLSSVAVLPKKRGMGMGLAMLHAVLMHPTLQGIDIFTAAQSETIVGFYRQAGFSLLPQLLTITEKRKP